MGNYLYKQELSELEDQSWFPNWMRTHQVSFLAFMAQKFELYRPVVPVLADIFINCQTNTWTDLASGAGGPVSFFKKAIPNAPIVVLTDKYPSTPMAGLPQGIKYHPQPVDIETTDPPQTGLITVFNGFHHFSWAARQKLLRHAAHHGRPLLVGEILTPGLASMLKVIVATTLGQLIFNPFVKPFRWHRIIFTYLLPLHLLTTLYDGLISVIKSPSKEELNKLVSQCNRPGYSFVIQPIQGRWVSGTLLIGKPDKNSLPPTKA